MNTDDRLRKLLSLPQDKLKAIDSILEDRPKPEPGTGPLLLSMSESARYLGISRASLWRACKAGRLVKIELFPGSYRLQRADVEALAAGRKGGTHEAQPK